MHESQANEIPSTTDSQRVITQTAWENLQQRSLAESMLIDHEALKELDDVHALIDWSHLEQMLASIHARTRGEKAWPPILIFKALYVKTGTVSIWMKMVSSRILILPPGTYTIRTVSLTC